MKSYLFTFTTLLLTLFLAMPLLSQEKKAVPFVSQLSAEAAFGKVRLSWKNPANFEQYISIYRSSTVIEDENSLKKATKIITLKEGEEEYIDSPQYGSYYYTLLVTSKFTQKDNIIFIPFRNYTTRPVTIEKGEYFEITSLSASIESSSIILEWDFKSESKAEKNLYIYRHTLPINEREALKGATKIANISIHKRSHIDSPPPNIRYYYALFLEDAGELTFVENVNITAEPISINGHYDALSRFDIDSFIPLPLLTFKNDPRSGRRFIDPMLLKSPKRIKYKKSVAKVIDSYKTEHKELFLEHEKEISLKSSHLPFHILSDEELYESKAFESEYSEAITLIKNSRYDEALPILESLLNESLSEELLKRVAYYTGAIYYHKGSFYKSYIYLVLPYESYRREVLPYLQSIYFNIYYSLER